MRMRVYYLDSPLDRDDLECLRASVGCGDGAPVYLEQVRVPWVLPLYASSLSMHTNALDKYARAVEPLLRRANVERDIGTQVIFIAPRESYWETVFQNGIHRLTGYFPITVSRWFSTEAGGSRRGPIQVVDTHRATASVLP